MSHLLLISLHILRHNPLTSLASYDTLALLQAAYTPLQPSPALSLLTLYLLVL